MKNIDKIIEFLNNYDNLECIEYAISLKSFLCYSENKIDLEKLEIALKQKFRMNFNIDFEYDEIDLENNKYFTIEIV